MNTNYLRTLNTEDVITKEDIILALTEAEVPFKKSAKKSDLMEVLIEAIEKAEAEVVEAQEAHDRMNANNGTEAIKMEAHVTSLEAEEEEIYAASLSDAFNSWKRAEAFYRIKSMKLYEVLKDEEGNPCKSFKSYVNDFRGGEVYGVKYAMAMHYVNLCLYVYPHNEAFKWWNTRLLVKLIKPLKNEETRALVLDAVEEGVINDRLTLEELSEVLDTILGNTSEEIDGNEAEADTEGEGEYGSSDTCDISEEALDEAVDIMEEFLEANAHDNTVTEAWYRILKKLDR
jgi:hypothetical protein